MNFFWLEIFMDACFLVDIYLNYKCFPYIENGVIVSDDELISKHYLSSWMIPDIISCIPLELIAYALSGWKFTHSIFQYRLIHMLRIFRLPGYLGKVDHYLNLWNIRVSAALNLLIRMFIYYILVNHSCACVWFIIHRYYEREVADTWATRDCPKAEDICMANWDEEKGMHDICSKENGYSTADCYTRSFYLVITTISTVGYGDIAPHTPIETFWEDCVVLIGACIFASIIGSFGALIRHKDTIGPNAFKRKMQKLKEYMQYRKLPSDLQTSILLHHKFEWRRSRILNEKAVMKILPLPLQLDLSFAVVSDVIRKVPILSECAKVMQKRIAHAFTIQTCAPKSIIYEAGDIGWDIYFIGSGLVKITLPKDLSVLDAAGKAASGRAKRKQDAIGNLYRIGNHFGESCLLSQSGVRQETSEARTIAQLYLLQKNEVEIICDYMSQEGREKFMFGLVSRNGNVRHSFGDDETDDESSAGDFSERMDTFPSGPGTSLFRGGQRPHRGSIDGGEGGLTSPNAFQQKNIRRKTIGLNGKSHDIVRLRSFSAEASKLAIRKKSETKKSKLGFDFSKLTGRVSPSKQGQSSPGSSKEDDTNYAEEVLRAMSMSQSGDSSERTGSDLSSRS